MTGNHHGHTAKRATLLVTATDEILGTHRELARLLADRGDLDQAEQILRASTDAANGDAGRLAGLLTRQGRGEEAERLRWFGLAPDGSTAGG